MNLVTLAFLFVFLLLCLKWIEVGVCSQFLSFFMLSGIATFWGLHSGVTLGICVITILSLIVYIFINKVKIKITVVEMLMVVTWLLLLVSLIYTTSPQYGFRKVQLFLAVPVMLVLVGRLCTQRTDMLSRTLYSLSWSALLLTLFMIIVFIVYRDAFTVADRFGARESGFNALGIGYVLAVSVVMLVYLIIKKPWSAAIVTPLIIGAVVVILATGSRGPFLGLVIGATLSLMTRKSIKPVLILCLVATILAGSLYTLTPETTRERILTLFEKGALEESGRSNLYIAGTKQFLDSPMLGGGVGSFSMYKGGEDERAYPHNIILEFAGENGIIGLALICTILILSICQILKLRKISPHSPLYWESKIIQWIFYIGIINAMLSFDMTDQRTLFFAIGMLAGTTRWAVLRGESDISSIEVDCRNPGVLQESY
ncbi:putative O-glycosylation ligase, exosortase A-associated [Limihaloglobus sulfuriphilus]|uniref:Putative O-glycosylation ligase, exosortase A-associated n=1 Tax=Limihaloglobus sulfuriphilus TaxID=1851148 RepID=A0A1Q2MFM2_9BACT|nr:O-antigen ligase family protein [Limihaloglobus sulfuriphilus]AQQ71505.1 putative O-glycosylation ligase, exosortase A-associated [Limihaloglobus sulfuriphilus]